MSSEFLPYEKIPESLKKMRLTADDYARFDKWRWVVTEKVHGANFSFVYERGKIGFAKRKSLLQWKDDFFGFQLVAGRMEEQLYQLFEALGMDIVAKQFLVYGELFGGEYPHPEVPSVPGLNAIQTGVYYAPAIEFCAFDIAVVPEDASAEKYYLDYATAQHYFERFAIFHAKPLFIGKFAQALEFDTRIQSTIPALLGLPKLESNLIEGVVIKPYDQSPELHLSRPVLKVKNEEFAEKKFHEAAKWSYQPDVAIHTEDLYYLLEELRMYVTVNRLDSVLSKTGSLAEADAERQKEAEQEFLQDVMTDFDEDNGAILTELRPDQLNWLKKRIIPDILKLITRLS